MPGLSDFGVGVMDMVGTRKASSFACRFVAICGSMAGEWVFAFRDLQIVYLWMENRKDWDWDGGVAAPERGYITSAKLTIYNLF